MTETLDRGASAVRDTSAPRLPRIGTARPGVQARAVFFAVALIEGADSPEARAWLRAGLRAWRREGGELLAHLHLPTARRFQIACRDLWLADAARYCAGATPWQRACELAREVARFHGRKWPTWRHLESVPAGARPVEACLWFACSAHDQLPRTARALYALTADAFPQDANSDSMLE